MKTIICIAGRTASGKSTIAECLCSAYGLEQVKSYTTRPPRNELERSGQSDHIFISEEEFNKIPREEIAAYTEINGYKYCTTLSILDQSDVYVIDPIGIQTLKEKTGGRYRFLEFLITAPESLRKKRYEERGGVGFEARSASEDEQFKSYNSYDYLVSNVGDIADAVAQIAARI